MQKEEGDEQNSCVFDADHSTNPSRELSSETNVIIEEGAETAANVTHTDSETAVKDGSAAVCSVGKKGPKTSAKPVQRKGKGKSSKPTGNIMEHPCSGLCELNRVRTWSCNIHNFDVLVEESCVKNPVGRNRKVTDYYPVRRSCRKCEGQLKSEEKKIIDDLIRNGKEEGMKVGIIDGKGRGVMATKPFQRGEFVVEYNGDLIEFTDAKNREAKYAQDPSTGCYMYYFQYLSKTYCCSATLNVNLWFIQWDENTYSQSVDATKETTRLGRLINHSKNGNCQTKLHDVDGKPHLILVASRDIAK
eukprot:g45526.t1